MSTLSKITSRFRSYATWSDSDWEQPLRAMLERISLASLGPAGELIELGADEWAILKGLEGKMESCRAANDMHGWRRGVEEYERRAIEFLRRMK